MICTVFLAGCSNNVSNSRIKLERGEIEENSIVLTVGDIEVKYSEVQNYCYLMKAQYESSFSSQLWKYNLGGDTTIGDEAKEEIVNMLTQMKIIGMTAKNEKVTLDNDEKDEALQKAEKVLAAASEEDRRKYFLTLQSLSSLYEENAIANKMFYIATDDADTEVSDEEARQARIQYLQVMTNGVNRNGVTIAMNEAEKSEALKKAQKLQAQAKNAENFLEFAKENTDSATTELYMGRDSTEPDAGVAAAALGLQKGEISEVIQTDSGFYIIYCVNDNDEDAAYARKEEIIEARQTAMFKKKYAEWLGDYEVHISQSFWKIFHI